MKRFFSGLLLCAFVTATPLALFSATPSGVKVSYPKLPLSFVKNQGQADKDVLFYERGGRHITVFALDGVSVRSDKIRKR